MSTTLFEKVQNLRDAAFVADDQLMYAILNLAINLLVDLPEAVDENLAEIERLRPSTPVAAQGGTQETLTIESERETDGRWIAEIPSASGCMAYGDTRYEAVVKACILWEELDADAAASESTSKEK